jgi:hypothetical protein
MQANAALKLPMSNVGATATRNCLYLVLNDIAAKKTANNKNPIGK